MYNGVATKVMTGEVRCSYVHLMEPYANPQQPGATPRYSVTLLIPKSDTATKADIDASISAAYEDAVKNKFHNARPQMRNALIYDGDGTRPNGTPFGPECKGHWVLTASSNRKPGVVHISNVMTELGPMDVYSGMYARVTLNFYSPRQGNPVACGLGNVCKTRDGEPLSGGASASEDFAGIGEAPAPAAPVMGAPTYQAPIQPQYSVPQGMPQQAAPAYQQAPVMGAPVMGTASQPQYNINPITGLPM